MPNSYNENSFFTKKSVSDFLLTNRNTMRKPREKRQELFLRLAKELYQSGTGKGERNEYIYKNEILNLRLSDTKPVASLRFLSEFRIWHSIADLVVLNGEGSVFEIKTELDKLERLANQLDDYFLCFPVVSVVTCQKHLDKVLPIAEKAGAGVYLLSYNGALIPVKETSPDFSRISKEALFSLLRKGEVKKLLCDLCLPVPKDGFSFFSDSKHIFCTQPISNADSFFAVKKILVQRKHNDTSLLLCLPKEIRFLAYESPEKFFKSLISLYNSF